MSTFVSVVDAVGGTPLIRLNRVTEGLEPTVYVKAEFLNPGGSVKDRAARSMVEAAEREGLLAPGATIVEAPATPASDWPKWRRSVATGLHLLSGRPGRRLRS